MSEAIDAREQQLCHLNDEMWEMIHLHGDKTSGLTRVMAEYVLNKLADERGAIAAYLERHFPDAERLKLALEHVDKGAHLR